MRISSRLLSALFATTLMMAGAPAQSQAQSQIPADYPNRQIRLIVPADAGSTSDVLTRLIVNEISPRFNIIVENRAGNSAIIGANQVAQAAPDGYTLGLASTTHLVNIALGRPMPFDFMTDLLPVTRLVGGSMIIAAHPSTGIKSLNDLIAQAKAKPGSITYATGGPGTPNHIAIARLMAFTKTDMLQVPFKSDTGGYNALLGGHVNIMSSGLSYTKPQVDKGELNALAVTSLERNKAYPKVPTVREILGTDAVETTSYWGILAPKGTPKPIVDLLSVEFNKAVSKPALKERIESMGYITVGSTPEEYAAHFKSELDRLNALVKAANIKPE